MVYCYVCVCGEKKELIREVADRDNEVVCDECGDSMGRDFLTESCPNVAVVRNEYTTDFGDGDGNKTYSREQYLTKCKTLGRNPVGMLWQNKEFKSDADTKVI